MVGQGKHKTAEFQRQLLFIPLYTSPDRSVVTSYRVGQGRDKQGKETQWPTSPSINWPRLFHAVVGL